MAGYHPVVCDVFIMSLFLHFSNKQHSGPGQGDIDGTKAGHKYTIIYKAKDNDGLTATCEFSFTVKGILYITFARKLAHILLPQS